MRQYGPVNEEQLREGSGGLVEEDSPEAMHPVNGQAVSPDGNYIVSSSQDGTVKLWDRKKGELYLSLQEYEHGVSSCAISLSGRYIISTSDDHKLKFWDVSTRRCLSTLLVESDLHTCVFYNDDTHLLAGGKLGLYFLQLS